MNKADVGAWGEKAATRYMRRKGFDIIEKNIHLSHQEIDIIALNRQYIVFVEVKTRVMDPNRANRFNAPGSAVTYDKQAHLLRAARRYLAEHTFSQQPRMDVIEIYLCPQDSVSGTARLWERFTGWFGVPHRKILKINHIENAFGAHGHRS